jgi:hypothetical protein
LARHSRNHANPRRQAARCFGFNTDRGGAIFLFPSDPAPGMVASDRIMTISSRHHSTQRPARGTALLALIPLLSLPLLASERDIANGRQIYLRHCTGCHGRDGEGVPDKYGAPLGGNRSLERIRRIIVNTMPEDDPELCVGEEAEAVARYIHHTFYSSSDVTQAPQARIELVRLTNRQYAQAVADLLGFAVSSEPISMRHGLKGAYYKARRFKSEDRIHERLDRQIQFDFGEGAPDADGIPSDEFSIRWRGSVRALDTGEYEFILRTPNGARLWVNDTAEPVVDAWVASGDLQETRASLKLLGGRVYPLRLDFFKSRDKRAAITLEWVPPHGTREVIPARHLSPDQVRPTFVVTTPFPPDDASVGYERGVAVSPAWDEAATHAAIELANHVVRHLDSLAGIPDGDEDRFEKVVRFCHRFVETAFRRPLSPDQKQFYVQNQFEAAANLETAVKRVIVLALKSPRFLYLGLDARKPDDFEVAARLSFGMWDSLPDEELLGLAGQGNLTDPDETRRQAQRMLEDPRSRAKVREFLHHWLQVGHADNLAKDPELYPRFTPRLMADLRTSLDLFLETVVWSDHADYRELLLADYLYVNPTLAEFYGVSLPEHDEFSRVAVASQHRAGVLTHPYLLALFAYPKTTSPIHRGVFLTRNIVGRGLKPPPVAVAFKDAEFDPSLSMREKVETLTRPEACQACHATINPLGFSLEHYDAVGRFRTSDGDRPVHASSDYVTTDGQTIHLTNARDLARHAAGSPPAHHAFIEQLFHQIVKQPVRAYGPDAIEQLRASFAASEFNIRQLIVDIALLSALHQVEHKPMTTDYGLRTTIHALNPRNTHERP